VQRVGLIESEGIELGDLLLDEFGVLFDGVFGAGDVGFLVLYSAEQMETLDVRGADLAEAISEVQVAVVTENEPAFVNSGVIDVRSGGGLAADGDGVGVVVREAEGAIGTENAEDQEEEGKEEADSAEDGADEAEHKEIVAIGAGCARSGTNRLEVIEKCKIGW